MPETRRMPFPKAKAKGQPEQKEDPIYVHSLREAKIILIIWAICLVFSCTSCYLFGYLTHPVGDGFTISAWVGPLESFDRHPDSLKTPLGLGIPDWVLYGIVAPWLACIAMTFWFCLFVFHNDELGNGGEVERCHRGEQPHG